MNTFLCFFVLLANTFLLCDASRVTRYKTPEPRTRTKTIFPNSEEVVDATSTSSLTRYWTSTVPFTTVFGTITTTVPNPITIISVSTTSISTSIDTGTISTEITITPVTPTSRVTSPSETSVSVSSSETSSVSGSETSSVSGSETSSVSGSETSSVSPSASSSETSSEVTSSSLTSSSLTSSSTSTSKPEPTNNGYPVGLDMFSPVDTNEPPAVFPRMALGAPLAPNVNINGPIHTNKFHNNFILGKQDLTVFSKPYDIFWCPYERGIAVTYTDESGRFYGPDASANPVEYYSHKLGVKSLVLSGEGFQKDEATLSVETSESFSQKLRISSSKGSVVTSIVQGMGMLSGIYNGVAPFIASSVGVGSLEKISSTTYKVVLNDGQQWRVYAFAPNGQDFEFKLNYGNLQGSNAVDGLLVQIAIVVHDENVHILDSAAGAYVVDATLTGVTTGAESGQYVINYETHGSSSANAPLVFALPHHVESFSAETTARVVGVQAYAGVKGYVTGVLSSTLRMEETLHTDLQWLPYQPGQGSVVISAEALRLIGKAVNKEIAQDMSQDHQVSGYFAGKALDKYAYILLVASEILQDEGVAKQGLESLKKAFDLFLQNKQLANLMYDTRFKGVTCSLANRGGQPMDDFGAPYYNDHHFHYGYLVHAAAVIGKIDAELNGTWAQDNKDWVNSLVRDVANPSKADTFFPVSRNFDFYNGHSWAAGLFESGDGKNQESSSEDYNFAYGMKLWGQVVGDKSMEARGDLLLSITKRSANLYVLMKDDNPIQPSNFIANRVPGISFENKYHHITFFGKNLEYIQGIHMLPITAASGLIRSREFVKQEYEGILSTITPYLTGSWNSVIRANQALYDPVSSFKYFSSLEEFPDWMLDNGASHSWYLALAAMLGGS